MQSRLITAALALTLCGSACADDAPPPPPPPPTAVAAPAPQPPAPGAADSIPVPMPLAYALPPLPPGCVTASPPAPQPPVMPVSNVALESALGLGEAKAEQVRQVFLRRAAQQQKLDQERNDLDAATCRSLLGIVGDQGLARWSSATPPPPRPDVGVPPPPPPR